MVAAKRARHTVLFAVLKIRQRCKSNKIADRVVSRLPLGEQCRTNGTHFARIRRTGHRLSQILFQCTQHRIIFEGAALYDNLFAEHSGIGYAHNFCEYIADNRAAQPRHNILRCASVFLFRDNRTVHKHGAAAAQIGGLPRTKRRIGNAIDRNSQCRCKSLQERTAAGRTGFIQRDIGHNTAVNPHGFHVLSADIQHKADIRHIRLCRGGMSDGLYRVIICAKRLGEHVFAITGCTQAEHL